MLSKINFVIALLSLLGVIFILYLQNFSSPKLVYVDSAKLLEGFKGMQHATNSYQQKTAIWQANIDTLSTDLRKQIIDYEKAAPKLTSNEQKLTQELIRTKQKQLRDYEEAIQNKLSKKTQNLLAKLLLR